MNLSIAENIPYNLRKKRKKFPRRGKILKENVTSTRSKAPEERNRVGYQKRISV